MAEVNDFFIRSLRSSTLGRRPAPSSPLIARSHQSTPDALMSHNKLPENNRQLMPPDLLANLLPAQTEKEIQSHIKKQTGEVKKQERCFSGAGGRLAIKTMGSSFPPANRTSTMPPCVVKEYQIPSKLIREKSNLRRHSSVADHVIESQVKIIPAWFPPANIPKLRRQDSFHGETSASKMLKAKQQASRSRSSRDPSTGKSNDSESSCDTPTILEESGGIVLKKPPKLQRPANLSMDTRTPSPVSLVCPRHLKHHSVSPLTSSRPKSPAMKRGFRTKSPAEKPPKTVFKFGTLPRSFKLSNSVPVPASVDLESLFKPLTPLESGEPKHAPGPSNLMRRPHVKARKALAKRNSWHVTIPVERPDVALPPTEKAWLDPLAQSSASSPQKLCTCGDTRKHVHLVKISDDLTLTDTRYFVQESDNKAEISSSLDDLRRNESESFDHNGSSDAPEADVAENCTENVEMNHDFLDTGSLTDSMSAVHKEIDSISYQDKSMLRKLLDMSDQIRRWNGGRKHRIRSVDSSPIMSRNNIFAVGTCGSIPPLLGKSSLEDMRLTKTYCSMESINMGRIIGQAADKPPFAFESVKDTTTSASQLRSNMHLSYSDLLRKSSQFWQPSQPGSAGDATGESAAKISKFVLREASLSLLL